MGTKTASIVVDGLYSGGWDSGAYTDIDEGTDSPNDADYIESSGAATDDVEFTITMPGDFISMNSATIKLRGITTGTKTYKKNLQHIRVYSYDESTYMFDIYSYSNPTFSTSWATYEIAVDVDPAVISGGINDKTTWDGAVVQIRANAESSGLCRISALQIDINYEGSGASVYNETGSGGIEGAGVATESVDAASAVYDETASGGIVGGGIAPANTNIVIGGNGGLLAAGAAIESVDVAGAVYDETASGGIVSAGTASANTNIVIDGNGGLLAAGTAQINANIAIVSTGGAVLGGTATDSEAETVTASGGIVGGGSSQTNTNIVIDAAGGLLAAGAAIESVDTASAVYNETASGGIVSAGTASAIISITIIATGGALLSGTATDSESETITAFGGAIISGTASAYVLTLIDASGGLVAAGSITPCVITDIDGAGGITGAGLVDAYTISDITSAGGAIMSGAAEIIESETVNVSGGIVGGSSADVYLMTAIISAAGGIGAAGTASVSTVITPANDLEIEHAIESYLNEVLDCSVYVAIRPQNTDLPAVTFRRTSGGYFHCLDGAVDFANPYFDFEIFSKNWSDCITISETIRQALQGFSGIKETREIYFATLTDEGDSYYAPADGSSKGTYSTTQTYRVMYREN